MHTGYSCVWRGYYSSYVRPDRQDIPPILLGTPRDKERGKSCLAKNRHQGRPFQSKVLTRIGIKEFYRRHGLLVYLRAKGCHLSA